mmetsp:Transcript_10146/g.38492  ORF Transcript_10146/g.38492 Transcript_10146/m.38492 type:complete len:314 (+) Transcript_10146:235-1176(+)
MLRFMLFMPSRWKVCAPKSLTNPYMRRSPSMSSFVSTWISDGSHSCATRPSLSRRKSLPRQYTTDDSLVGRICASGARRPQSWVENGTTNLPWMYSALSCSSSCFVICVTPEVGISLSSSSSSSSCLPTASSPSFPSSSSSTFRVEVSTCLRTSLVGEPKVKASYSLGGIGSPLNASKGLPRRAMPSVAVMQGCSRANFSTCPSTQTGIHTTAPLPRLVLRARRVTGHTSKTKNLRRRGGASEPCTWRSRAYKYSRLCTGRTAGLFRSWRQVYTSSLVTSMTVLGILSKPPLRQSCSTSCCQALSGRSLSCGH